MYKVLITTSISTHYGCHASSTVVEFYGKTNAEDAVANAGQNSSLETGVVVTAVLLNPEAN
jgi:hypothetical protein